MKILTTTFLAEIDVGICSHPFGADGAFALQGLAVFLKTFFEILRVGTKQVLMNDVLVLGALHDKTNHPVSISMLV
jgi:hypothetical protein